jgi:hypothetical protein
MSLAMHVPKERVPYNVVGDHSNIASKGSLQVPGSGYRTSTQAKLRQITRKSTSGDTGSSRKRLRTEIPATSSGFALTNINTTSRGSEQIIGCQNARDFPSPLPGLLPVWS